MNTSSQMHAKINVKSDLVNALYQQSIKNGRVKITKKMVANWGLFANKLIHPKN